MLVAAATTVAALGAPTAASAEEIYLIRGFMNIWSRGMDQMSSQLRARGCNARSISNGQWQGLAQDIIQRDRNGRVSHPIVIAGHSVGGIEAPQFANALGQAGVSTALVVGVDPGFNNPPPFQRGAQRVVNFWIAGSARGKPYRAGNGFSGSLQNINVRSFSNADHVQLEKDPRVQSRIVNLMAAAAGC
jgi:hypothetical protein